MQELVAVSSDGDQLPLFDIVAKSQANPALRRAELMTRMRGFEDIANYSGHGAIFITPTTPSEFHRTHSTGKPNEKWKGHSPRDGQTWLCRTWARCRAIFHRLGLMVYGFRIAEPHHDGTPHWHMVLFGAKQTLLCVNSILANEWRRECRDDFYFDNGAIKSDAWNARYQCKIIDSAKGTATGYLAKYVSKNIDGFNVGLDHETRSEEGEDSKGIQEIDATSSVDRVAAWASAHGIRQFQQIGGPPVSLWRELRRIRDCVGIEKIETARKAADEGDWSAFVVAVGGIAAGRNTQLTLWKETTGEINQYEEMRAAQVVGVQALTFGTETKWRTHRHTTKRRVFTRAAKVACGVVTSAKKIRTRTKTWRIQRKSEGEKTCVAKQSESQSWEPGLAFQSGRDAHYLSLHTGEHLTHQYVESAKEKFEMIQRKEGCGDSVMVARAQVTNPARCAGSNPAICIPSSLWRIQRKAETPGGVLSVTDKCGKAVQRGAALLASGSLPSLGLVSITVRQPRSDGVAVIEQYGRWIVERTKLRKRATETPQLNPKYNWIQTAPYSARGSPCQK